MPQLTLLSLNTFGLPLFLGWSRLGRLTRELDNYTASVICLQEIQQNAYVPLLLRNLPDYPHHAFEVNWFAPKGGLFTAARAPMQASKFIPYQNRGRPFGAGIADWALNKGVLESSFNIGAQRVIVMNTHLHANYRGDWNADYALTRIQRDQVQHLAEMVRAQPRDAVVIVCGDFNFPRGTSLYSELVEMGELEDPLAEDPRPTYRPFPLLNSAKWSVPIDFVLVRRAPWRDFKLDADIVHIEDRTRRLPTGRFLTDHNALTLHVEWTA